MDACSGYIFEYIKLIVNVDYLKFRNCSNLINKKLCEKIYEGIKIEFSESEIYIKLSLIKSTVINIARNLSNKISIINNQLKNENFQNIIMTGGFSQCSLLRNIFPNIWEEEQKSSITLKF